MGLYEMVYSYYVVLHVRSHLFKPVDGLYLISSKSKARNLRD